MLNGRCLLVSAALLGLVGCDDEWTVTIQNRMTADGWLYRDTTIMHTGQEREGKDPFEIYRLPVSGVERQGNRVRLRASARVPEKLSADVVLVATGGRPDPHNDIGWEVHNDVFFDRYVYQENYRDSVDLDGVESAAKGLHGYIRDIVLQAAQSEAAGRYDLGPLRTWWAGPGERLVHDLIRMALTERDGKKVEARSRTRLACEGLAEKDDSSGDVLKAMLGLMIKKWEVLLVPRAGQPPYSAAHLLGKDEGQAAARESLWEKAMVHIHGSKDDGEQALLAAWNAVAGDMRNYRIRFNVSLQLPGRMLSTNGSLDPNVSSLVLWSFESEEINVTGHRLEAVSIVPKLETQRALPSPKGSFGAPEVLATIDALAEYNAEQREKLSEAIMNLHQHSPDSVRAGLPADLQSVFDKLLKIGGA